MITYAILTNTGSRQVNEDSVGMLEDNGIFWFALADGLGGHGKGEVASALAVEEGLKIAAKTGGDIKEGLTAGAIAAQDRIIREQQKTGLFHEMKTTLVMLAISDGQAGWMHVGDSRLYRFSRDKLEERTLDHSVPQMLVAQGELKERDIRFHEDRNRLLRVLGTKWESPRMDISRSCPTGDNSSFLLCSDGFWELIGEKEMSRLLKKSNSPELWLHAMEQIVIKNGAGKNMDNYSAIAVFVRGDALWR